ncbi:MAG: phage virion morphogenesis protein [Candidatus Accumulibacter sp.]|nr:phage virion morphogenesis protein [Accumulibacter sp.]MCM8627363.1 phage virion morphogenesis protein [Accumulibacter sp.]
MARSAADTSPVMRAIAGVMHDAVMENFQQGGRPAWVPLKPATLAQKSKFGYGDKTLIRRGAGQSLYSSITSRTAPATGRQPRTGAAPSWA